MSWREERPGGARRGRRDECIQYADSARAAADRTGADTVRAAAGASVGLLELGLGQVSAALEALEPVAEFTNRLGLKEPHVLRTAPDLIEAYTRSDRRQAAETALTRLTEQAHHTGGRWAMAAAQRCQGMLAPDDAFESSFAASLETDAGGSSFDRARTEKLGAVPWAERARAELVATGVSTRTQEQARGPDLTPQETQVARIVALGMSNRDAAAALFVTPKTIEFHLGHIYRKLGVHTRTQLAVHVMGTRRTSETLGEGSVREPAGGARSFESG